MRRLLLPLLALSLAPFAAPAVAGCDPETGECHPSDCLAWEPLRAVDDVVAGDPANAVTWLLPPPCPA